MIVEDGIIKIKINKSILAIIRSYCQVSRNMPEAGGVILGRENISNDNLIIEAISEPLRNDKQTRTRFIRQDQEHVEWFEKIYVESNNTIRYVGEWHTHPEDVPHYSSLDMLNWRKIKKYANKSVINYHIIAGRKALAIWKIMGENRLPVSIGTYLWKDIIDSEKNKVKDNR